MTSRQSKVRVGIAVVAFVGGISRAWGAAAITATTEPAPLALPPLANVTYGAGGCPVFLANGIPYDAYTLQPLGSASEALPGPGGPGGRGGFAARGFETHDAINPEGTLMAHWGRGKKSITVARIGGGEEMEVPLENGDLQFMAFAGNEELIFAQGSNTTTVWDVKGKKALRTVKTDDAPGWNSATVSLSGHYYAVAGHNSVGVYDTRTGARAALMAPPSPEAHRINAWPGTIEQISFSDDTRELAAINNWGRLVVWNYHGQVVLDADVGAFNVKTLAWLPDGSGWLLNGERIFSRELKQDILRRANPMNEVGGTMVSQDEYLGMGRMPNGQTCVRLMRVPWDEMDRGIAAESAGEGPSLLRPGGTLSVSYKLDRLGGDAGAVEQEFGQALGAALDRENIKIAPGAPVTLVVEYVEEQGLVNPNEMRIANRGTLSHPNAQGAPETKTIAQLRLSLEDATGKKLWELPAGMAGFRYPMEGSDPATERKTAEQLFSRNLQSAPVPIFVGTDASTVLPVYMP